jgi:hypothetical protein
MAIRKKSVVGTFAGLLNGCVAIFVAAHVFQWVLTDRWPAEPQNLWPFLLALAILLVNVVYLVLFFKEAFGGGEMRYITSRAPDGEGTARISVRALRAALRRAVLEADGVAAARVRLRRVADGQIRISATVRARRERNAVELAGRVREILRRSFFRVVPDDGDMKLHVVVKIASLGGAPALGTPEALSEVREESREEEMFTGPRYPVEDMEGV